MSAPPLGLNVEISDADGNNTNRWSSASLNAGDRPDGISFNTKRGDGFADAGCTLSRRIDGEYVDLGLLREFRLVGDDGSVAYEGRITGLPRSMDAEHSISVQTAGWMAHAKDRKFREIFVDRDLSRWTGPSVQRKVNYNETLVGSPATTVTPDSSTGRPALEVSLTGAWGGPAASEAWYDGAGIPLGAIAYAFRAGPLVNTADPLWSWQVALSTDDVASAFDITGNLRAASGADRLDAGDRRGFGLVQLRYNGAAGSSSVAYQVFWDSLAVYGVHGLTQRVADTSGLFVSDIIRNIAARFTPKLDISGVQDTTYILEHSTFLERTYPYDAFTALNAYHLWSLSVWENKRLTFAPVDLTDYDWEVRLSDPGVQVSLQGDSAADLANGIAVSYTDVVTGQSRQISPDQYPELADQSVENPANLAGLQVWTEITLSTPVTLAMALQLGRAALAEFNSPKAPGTIKVKGHIRDRAGHLQPVWKVRADDRIIIKDFVNDRPRLIVETSYDHSSLTTSISVDAPAQRMDAVFDRIQSSLGAANL